MSYTCEFDDLSDALIRIQAAAEAAEAQGILCGQLCALGRIEKQPWKQQVLGNLAVGDDLLIKEASEQLDQLYDETVAAMFDDAYAFQLFQPDDDVSMSERIESLGEWCQGFLLGYSELQQQSLEKELQEEIDGLLADFVDITQLDPDVEGDEQDDESSLFEVQEYIRVGVLFIFSSLHPKLSSHRLQ